MTQAQTYADLVSSARAVTEELVSVERHEHHAVLRLADPDKRNALSAALMVQMHDAAAELVADPRIRAVILTGSGPAFCAGGDLRLMQSFLDGTNEPEQTEGAFLPFQWIRHRFGAFARMITAADTIFIAALNGSAAGVGLAFALNCDIVLAAEGATLVPAFGRLGLIPEVGTSWALTRALGYRRALAFYIAGDPMNAQDAQALGLVDELVPGDQLLDRASEWCRRVAELPPHALALAKPLLRAAADSTREQSLLMEEYAEPICFTTQDFADGVRQVSAAVHNRA